MLNKAFFAEISFFVNIINLQSSLRVLINDELGVENGKLL
jgi:hypothetical protein